MPTTKKPEISTPSSANSRPLSTIPTTSVTHPETFPPPPSQDSRLKRPLANKRSGGPRTAEGRARSSLNAIKHGGYVTANSAALEFQATLSDLISRINPVGVVEEGVVN